MAPIRSSFLALRGSNHRRRSMGCSCLRSWSGHRAGVGVSRSVGESCAAMDVQSPLWRFGSLGGTVIRPTSGEGRPRLGSRCGSWKFATGRRERELFWESCCSFWFRFEEIIKILWGALRDTVVLRFGDGANDSLRSYCLIVNHSLASKGGEKPIPDRPKSKLESLFQLRLVLPRIASLFSSFILPPLLIDIWTPLQVEFFCDLVAQAVVTPFLCRFVLRFRTSSMSSGGSKCWPGNLQIAEYSFLWLKFPRFLSRTEFFVWVEQCSSFS